MKNNKILSILLASTLILTMAPTVALARGGHGGGHGGHSSHSSHSSRSGLIQEVQKLLHQNQVEVNQVEVVKVHLIQVEVKAQIVETKVHQNQNVIKTLLIQNPLMNPQIKLKLNHLKINLNQMKLKNL